jgi:HK97 family phage portal protein
MSVRERIASWVTKALGVSYDTADPRLAELFGAVTQTASAISVTPENALRCTPVAAAVRDIADPIATLPLRLVRIGADGSRKAVQDHPVAELLTGDWCPWASSQEGRRQVTIDALMRDVGGVAMVTRVDGRPREIVRLPPGTVSATYSAIGEPTWTLAEATGSRVLDPADVIHVASTFAHPPSPRCPLSLSREAIAVAVAMERHAGALMGRAARPGGVIERSEATPVRRGPEQEKQQEQRLNDAWGAFKRSGETMILPVGAKFVGLEFKSVDMQFLELRKFQIEEIARAFGVPPHRLYELGRATWSNISDMGREFVDYTLSPWLRTWEAALARALLTSDERREFAIEFDTDDLTLPSLADQATAYGALVAARIANPNECRAWMSLPAYEGGHVFANPNTTIGGKPDPQPEPNT